MLIARLPLTDVCAGLWAAAALFENLYGSDWPGQMLLGTAVLVLVAAPLTVAVLLSMLIEP